MKSVKRYALCRSTENGKPYLKEVKAYPFEIDSLKFKDRKYELCVHLKTNVKKGSYVVSELHYTGLECGWKSASSIKQAREQFIAEGFDKKTARILDDLTTNKSRGNNSHMMQVYTDLLAELEEDEAADLLAELEDEA